MYLEHFTKAQAPLKRRPEVPLPLSPLPAPLAQLRPTQEGPEGERHAHHVHKGQQPVVVLTSTEAHEGQVQESPDSTAEDAQEPSSMVGIILKNVSFCSLLGFKYPATCTLLPNYDQETMRLEMHRVPGLPSRLRQPGLLHNAQRPPLSQTKRANIPR